MSVFSMPIELWYSQIILGLVNGAFYSLLSLGFAVIFGLLGIVNFVHGALFMMGAFTAWMLLQYMGVGYWPSLIIAPTLVALFGVLLERLFIARVRGLDHLYGFILTYGMTLVIEGVYRNLFGAGGLPYRVPELLRGPLDLGFMSLPLYRGWVVAASVALSILLWVLIERSRLGMTLRAATENAPLVQALGINVPRLITLAYGLGAGLAALTGVLAAPIYSVNASMGSNVMIVVFAVVVIGGMGSLVGSIVTGYLLGLVEAITKVVYPPASSTVIFLVMVLVLVSRPAGLFGRED